MQPGAPSAFHCRTIALLLVVAAAVLTGCAPVSGGIPQRQANGQTGQGSATELRPHEIDVLKLDLACAQREGGSATEAERIHAALLAAGLQPEELEPVRLRAAKLLTWRGNISQLSGKERDDRIRDALGCGYTLEELHLDLEGPIDASLRDGLVESLITRTYSADSGARIAQRLGREELPPETVARIVDVVRTADATHEGYLLTALGGTPTEPVLDAAWRGVTDLTASPNSREGHVMLLVATDRAGSRTSALLDLLQRDAAFRPTLLPRLLGDLMRRGVAVESVRARNLALARRRDAPPDQRMAALGNLGLHPTPSELDALQGILEDPSEPPPIRWEAFMGLRTAQRIDLGDGTHVRLLRDDPSLEFRAVLVKAVSRIGRYPGDAELRAAVAEAEAAIAAAPSSRN